MKENRRSLHISIFIFLFELTLRRENTSDDDDDEAVGIAEHSVKTNSSLQ